MVLDAVSNFVRGTADAAVGTSDTTVSVADASIFPDPATDGEFNVVIWDANNFPRPDQDSDVEIMRVTARDTTDDELTITRAQETTTAAAHPEGSAIHLSPTAKMFSDIESTFDDFWDAGSQELTADVNNTNTSTTVLEADGAVIGRSNEHKFTGFYDGSDADERLTNALMDASDGDTIYLETADYEEDRTISKRITIRGSGFEGAKVEAEWTLEDLVRVKNLGTAGADIILASSQIVYQGTVRSGTTITVSADNCVLYGLVAAGGRPREVIFESETSGNIIDASGGSGLQITDNGDNVVGDIA